MIVSKDTANHQTTLQAVFRIEMWKQTQFASTKPGTVHNTVDGRNPASVEVGSFSHYL